MCMCGSDHGSEGGNDNGYYVPKQRVDAASYNISSSVNSYSEVYQNE